jgi:hypothetical protein
MKRFVPACMAVLVLSASLAGYQKPRSERPRASTSLSEEEKEIIQNREIIENLELLQYLDKFQYFEFFTEKELKKEEPPAKPEKKKDERKK